jgi:FkbM family methyltransferase
VYAAGVGRDISFDLALIQRFGLVVHAFDPTPASIAWVRAQELPAGFVLHEHGLADFDGEALFYPPADPAHVSHTILERPMDRGGVVVAPMKRLVTVVAALGHERIDVLKLDIEGAEYGVIEDLANGALRPGQVLVEFHHRFPGIGASRTHAAISRLRGIGYGVFSVSPTGEEFCFLHQPSVIAV